VSATASPGADSRPWAGRTGRVGPVPARRTGRAAGGRTPRIALLAHSGRLNLGDEILFASTLAWWRRRIPDGRFVAFTMNPADTVERYGLDGGFPVRPVPRNLPVATPAKGFVVRVLRSLRWRIGAVLRECRFALRSAARLRGTDLLLVTGSSQFIEAYGGAWAFPFTLLRWTLLSRLLGVPVGFLSMGAETMERPLSRWMTRRTVALATYISVRDPVSRSRLEAQGVRRPLPVVPDLAFGLEAPLPASAGEGGTVAVNPIPYYHPAYWRAVDESRYRRYLGAMIELTEDLLRRGQRVVLFATTPWADGVPIDDIHAALRDRLPPALMERLERPAASTLDELRAVLAPVDRIVASRYHGAAIGLLLGKPVVALCYEQKTADLMDAHGLLRYAIPMEEADGTVLAELVRRLEADEAEIRAGLEGSVARDRAAVHGQFEAVFRMSGIAMQVETT